MARKRSQHGSASTARHGICSQHRRAIDVADGHYWRGIWAGAASATYGGGVVVPQLIEGGVNIYSIGEASTQHRRNKCM